MSRSSTFKQPAMRIPEFQGARLSWLRADRTRTLLFVLVLGILGYWLAPSELPPGNYTAHVEATINQQPVALAFPFTVGQEGREVSMVQTSIPGYEARVEGVDGYASELGQTLTYRLRVIDTAGEPVPLELDQATSVILGRDYQQRLPPIERDGDALLFSMRLPYRAKIAFGLLFAVAALWLTELVPLAAAAMLIPIVVVAGDVAGADLVLQPFAHPVIVLFLAGFLMAEGMRRVGLDRRAALLLLSHASLQPATLMLTMMALTAFLSMWMSNTASVALVIPIALSLLEQIPDEVGRSGYRRALILSVAYAATIGGIGSAIGTPANMLAITFLNEFTGADLAFIHWFAYGLPVTLLMLPIIWIYLLITFRVRLRDVGAHFSREVYRSQLAAMGPADRRQWLILLTFLAVITLWLTEQWHGISPGIVALAGAFILFLARILSSEDLNRINWNALLTFGGGLAIGAVLVSTGVSDWLALQLIGLAHLPPWLVVLLVAGLTLATGAFISNTACAAMLIPLAIPLARLLQLDPRLLVAVIAIGSSIDFALVVGTPPTMMAYSTGFFRVNEIMRRGLILDLIGLLLLALGVVWIWRWLGVVS